MKSLLTAAFFICLCSLSCSKNSAGERGLITGRWELRGMSGGFAGNISYPPGNGVIISFQNNGQYAFFTPGSADKTGTYTLRATANPQDWILMTYYTSNNQAVSQKDSIELSGNRMTFLSPVACCDIANNYYDRLPL